MPITSSAVPVIGNQRYLPTLVITRPDAIAATSRPAISGIIARPDFVAL